MEMAPTAHRRRLRSDDLLLAAVMLMFGLINMRFVLAGDWSAALFVIQQGVVVVLAICRRPAKTAAGAASPAAVIAWVATLLPFLLRPDTRAAGSLYTAGVGLQLAGEVLAFSATLALGRSFGVVAANRGVQISGPYRFVRHPIYAGYALALIGLVLAHPTPWNAAVLLAQFAAQAWRITFEERELGADGQYQEYRQRVRYRVLPGIW